MAVHIRLYYYRHFKTERNNMFEYDCYGGEGNMTVCNEVYRRITPFSISVVLAIWQTMLVVFGVLGNSVVIFAGSQYSAFNLDSVTVFFVQHLAVADLIYTVTITTPCALTHILRGWFLGYWPCVVYGYLVSFLSPVSFLLTMSISLHRIARCYRPMQMTKFKKKHAVITVVVIWIIAFVANIMFIGHAPSGTLPQFNPSFPLCYFNVEGENYPLVLKIHLIVFMGIPFNIIVLTNILLLRYSKQKTKDLRKVRKEKEVDAKRGFNTIYLISALLITTWTPLVTVDFLRSFFSGVIRSHHFMRVAGNAFLVSSCGNPIIYCFANPKFKAFLIKLMSRCYSNAKSSLMDSIGMSSTTVPRDKGTSRSVLSESTSKRSKSNSIASLGLSGKVISPRKSLSRLSTVKDISETSNKTTNGDGALNDRSLTPSASKSENNAQVQEVVSTEQQTPDDDIIQEVDI
ncbi:hypothetical protein ACHWQZ_G017652 [Mnemiopsis leidyi]